MLYNLFHAYLAGISIAKARFVFIIGDDIYSEAGQFFSEAFTHKPVADYTYRFSIQLKTPVGLALPAARAYLFIGEKKKKQEQKQKTNNKHTNHNQKTIRRIN